MGGDKKVSLLMSINSYWIKPTLFLHPPSGHDFLVLWKLCIIHILCSGCCMPCAVLNAEYSVDKRELVSFLGGGACQMQLRDKSTSIHRQSHCDRFCEGNPQMFWKGTSGEPGWSWWRRGHSHVENSLLFSFLLLYNSLIFLNVCIF